MQLRFNAIVSAFGISVRHAMQNIHPGVGQGGGACRGCASRVWCGAATILALSIPAFADNYATAISPFGVGNEAPYNITHPGSYQLTGDLVATTTTAIKISASNVTLDLNGFTISCSACQGVPGIVSSGTGTIVQNGTVGGFGGTGAGNPYGIQFEAAGGRVDHVTAESNYVGIYGASGADVVVTNSRVVNNTWKGISCPSSQLTVMNTTVSGNGHVGIDVAAGLITGNTITGNGSSGELARGGIVFEANGGTVNVTNNLIANNNFSGIALRGGLATTGVLGYGSNTFAANCCGGDVAGGGYSGFISMKNNANADGVF
jgi:parallel beta helix pectate lyase-like protein